MQSPQFGDNQLNDLLFNPFCLFKKQVGDVIYIQNTDNDVTTNKTQTMTSLHIKHRQ